MKKVCFVVCIFCFLLSSCGSVPTATVSLVTRNQKVIVHDDKLQAYKVGDTIEINQIESDGWGVVDMAPGAEECKVITYCDSPDTQLHGFFVEYRKAVILELEK